jgi:hypothetical protein
VDIPRKQQVITAGDPEQLMVLDGFPALAKMYIFAWYPRIFFCYLE